MKCNDCSTFDGKKKTFLTMQPYVENLTTKLIKNLNLFYFVFSHSQSKYKLHYPHSLLFLMSYDILYN